MADQPFKFNLEIKPSHALARGEMLMTSDGRVLARVRHIGCSPDCGKHLDSPCEQCGKQWGSNRKIRGSNRKIIERKNVFWGE